MTLTDSILISWHEAHCQHGNDGTGWKYTDRCFAIACEQNRIRISDEQVNQLNQAAHRHIGVVETLNKVLADVGAA